MPTIHHCHAVLVSLLVRLREASFGILDRLDQHTDALREKGCSAERLNRIKYANVHMKPNNDLDASLIITSYIQRTGG